MTKRKLLLYKGDSSSDKSMQKVYSRKKLGKIHRKSVECRSVEEMLVDLAGLTLVEKRFCRQWRQVLCQLF